ncbi:MAG: hypothetical protein AAF938_23585 [Myxococcota bacterium]
MARQIVVQLGEGQASYALKKLDRSKLYKQRKRVHLGPDGEPCTRAQLTSDGEVLVQSGMTAQGYYTDEGYWVANKELVGLDAEGNPVEPVKTTLGVPQALEVADPRVLLDLRVKAVYALELAEGDDALSESLAAGTIYRFPFAYRDGFDADEAVLLQNPAGDTFAIVGNGAEPVWQDVKAIVPVIEDDEDDDLDFDFESF